ncbi:galactose-1-epimerase [candidate division KSB1 bacterium]|nr:galactose-1-epimerase [candidate division KSB1 bacterium]
MPVDKRKFGQLDSGAQVDLFTLTNRHGLKAEITNYGGIITSLQVPDRNGDLSDIVLGFDSLERYLDEHPYFGALVGRYANRIANGLFELDGKQYILAKNNGPNHLHGGESGFDKQLWKAEPVLEEERCGLKLDYASLGGEEGYPGTLVVTVTYWLDDENELRIDYEAFTDKPTIINLTNHSYFNLRDAGKSHVLDHQILIHADAFTPVNDNLIPTGEFRRVDQTPFDFGVPVEIGARIDDDDRQLHRAGGYDHNYIINGQAGELRPAAEVYEPESGRVLYVLTTEPGMQFYSGNFLDGSITGKNHIAYHKRNGFCLETQHYPNSPNRSQFPSTRLNPKEMFRSTTVYAFSTR